MEESAGASDAGRRLADGGIICHFMRFQACKQPYHKSIRPQMGLGGKNPAEAAGIEVGGENKWLTLIQNAAKVKNVKSEVPSPTT